jgi:formylglycine-generating enzyme required for sulfatase activity
MAPEQWKGTLQDAKTDQYALAVVAYEMLAGRVPFENDNWLVLKEAVLHGDIASIPGLPVRAMDALRRGLAKRPEERFRSCGEFVAALGGKTKLTLKSSAIRPVNGPKGRRRKSGGWGWLAALAVAAGLGAAAWRWQGWPLGTPREADEIQRRVAEMERRLEAERNATEKTRRELARWLALRQQQHQQEAGERNTADEDTPVPIPTLFAPFCQGAILWYDFDDGKCPTWDKSGSGNHGSVMGAAWRMDGRGNGFFEFDGLPGTANTPDQTPDGNHDFIRVSETTSGFPVRDFTISIVCRPENEGTIIGSGEDELWEREWHLRYDRFGWAWVPGHASGAVGRQRRDLSFPGRAGLLQHLVVRRTGRRVEIALNGEWVAGSDEFPESPLPVYSYGLFFGNEKLDHGKWRRWNCLKGTIHHVMIWNRALSDSEANGLWCAADRKYDIANGEKRRGAEAEHGEAKSPKSEEEYQHSKAEAAEPGAGKTKTIVLRGGAEMEMVWCPPGTFLMGSPANEEGRNADETQHRVTLSEGFWMAKTEVTQKQWTSVMGNNPSEHKGDDLPVECVSWTGCQDFCRKTGLRLPTEAEWEYACRAGSEGPYAGSGRLEDMGWVGDDKTHPVGQKRPNAWGLYDMHGNVWEWCADWYDAGYYAKSPGTDPKGPDFGVNRILRGGGYWRGPQDCRSAHRHGSGPNRCSAARGFRPVLRQEP